MENNKNIASSDDISQEVRQAPVENSDGLTLKRIYEHDQICTPSPAMQKILEVFERTLINKESETLLVWPQRPEEVSIVHSLASKKRIANCDTEKLATLFFPWCRSTSATQRTLLLDRLKITQETLPALNRILQKKPPANDSFGYLMSLHSLKHLFSSGKKNTRLIKALELDPGLEHPTLFEILPQINIEESRIITFENHFLRRLQRHTWLGDTQHINGAINSLRTPFVMFGVHAKANRTRLLRPAGLDPKHSGRKPDIVLVDLTRLARNRLGKDWRKAVSRFLTTLRELYGDDCPPLLTITEDVFVLQALRWDIVKEYDVQRKVIKADKRPAKAQLVLNSNPDPFFKDDLPYPSIPEITADLYGSDILSFVSFGMKLRRTLAEGGDEELADTVMTAVDVIQNLIGLPGSPRQFFEFLEEHYQGFEKQSLGARFDHMSPRGKIKTALNLGLAGANHKSLTEFLSAFDKLGTALSANNPGSDLFKECIKDLSRKASKSIIIFSSELIRGFAEWRIENDANFSDIRDSVEKKILLLDKREAIEELQLSHAEKKFFQRIVFIEPYADDFLLILTRHWLPAKVSILSNLARAENIIRRLKILLDIEGVEPVREILSVVEKELERALEGRNVDFPDLDSAPLPMKLGTLDLTAIGTSASGPTRIIGTSSDFQIKAFDGSEMALYNPDSLQVFSKKLAKDLQVDDQICVFSPDFVGMAREKLNLRTNASEILVLYHKAVVEAAEKLPGYDLSSKASALEARMKSIDPLLQMPGHQSLRSWINVADLIDSPRDEVRPQAPKDRRRFLTFMKALDIDENLAKNYWDFGVFWTRSMRIRNGAAFHQVFMSILIDPYGAANSLPAASRHDVWRIYETAEHHIVTVRSNEREEKL
ncbi:MAG: hypothetical protein WBK55_09640 [Alphaproteobacteria bacterium]